MFCPPELLEPLRCVEIGESELDMLDVVPPPGVCCSEPLRAAREAPQWPELRSYVGSFGLEAEGE